MQSINILSADNNHSFYEEISESFQGNIHFSFVNSLTELKNFPSAAAQDIIIVNSSVSEQNGIDLICNIKENPNIICPVILLSENYDRSLELDAVKNGAYCFMTLSLPKETIVHYINNAIKYSSLCRSLKEAVKNKTSQINQITIQAITAIANTIDAKDKYTKGHSVRVSLYSVEIARRLGWSEADITNIQYIALLHDIGKIGIPDTILNKPARLTDEEYSIIQKHTVIGSKILADVTMIKGVVDGAAYHHERFDGGGYMKGLKGKEIPLVARIIGIADAFDAMTSNRAYRNKLDKSFVIDELRKCSGSQFDPELTEIMLQMIADGLDYSGIFTTDRPDERRRKSTNDDENARFVQELIAEFSEESLSNSQKDKLTGLWNCIYAQQRISDHLSKHLSYGAFILLDIDDFHSINLNLGHIAGDEILRQTASILTSKCSETDILCRGRDDEFYIFVTETASREEILEKCKTICRQVSDSIRFNTPNGEIIISISASIAIAPLDGNNFSSLYHNAEKAMYHINQTGKGKVLFYSNETNVRKLPKAASGDLKYLKNFIEEKGHASGAYHVEYEGFKKIYHFIARCIERTHQNVQLVLFTITDTMGHQPPEKDLFTSFEALRKSVSVSLRRGDVATNYSSSQYMVILMDASNEQGYMVAERILEAYARIYSNPNVELHYDIEEVSS